MAESWWEVTSSRFSWHMVWTLCDQRLLGTYVSTVNTTITTQWKFQHKHYINTATFNAKSDIFVYWQLSENIHAGITKEKLYLLCILWVLRNHYSQAQEIWFYYIYFIINVTNHLAQNCWEMSNQYPSFLGSMTNFYTCT